MTMSNSPSVAKHIDAHPIQTRQTTTVAASALIKASNLEASASAPFGPQLFAPMLERALRRSCFCSEQQKILPPNLAAAE
jgi:hypothetical protein